jgi:hypothetical protein
VAILVGVGEGVLVPLEQFCHFGLLDSVESSLDVDVIVHEEGHFLAVVDAFVEADLPPEVVDVFYATANHLLFAGPQ